MVTENGIPRERQETVEIIFSSVAVISLTWIVRVKIEFTPDWWLYRFELSSWSGGQVLAVGQLASVPLLVVTSIVHASADDARHKLIVERKLFQLLSCAF